MCKHFRFTFKMKEKQKRGIVMALVSKKERKKIEKKRKILHSLFSPIRDETAIFHGLHNSSSIRYTSTKSVSLISLSFTYNIYLCTTSV